MDSRIKKSFIGKRLFIFLYLSVMLVNFSIPFLLPPRITGAYLFWVILPLSVIALSFTAE
ncbi:MAG: hypothetical protein GXP33_01985 [Spirochaetes bacterium]|nr:hypothetical protein [Spirochaetota bacterium]